VIKQSIFVIFLSLLPLTSNAETVYVTDLLRLNLHEGPKSQGEVIKTIISGDSLNIIERQPGYAKVKTADNVIGWTKSAYLVTEQPPRLIVKKMEKQLSKAKQLIKKSNSNMQIALVNAEKYQKQLLQNESKTNSQLIQLEKLKAQNKEFELSMSDYKSSVPLSAYLISILVFFIIGAAIGWYIIDYRIRKRHGGFRLY